MPNKFLFFFFVFFVEIIEGEIHNYGLQKVNESSHSGNWIFLNVSRRLYFGVKVNDLFPRDTPTRIKFSLNLTNNQDTRSTKVHTKKPTKKKKGEKTGRGRVAFYCSLGTPFLFFPMTAVNLQLRQISNVIYAQIYIRRLILRKFIWFYYP